MPGLDYPHRFAAEPNTGVPSGFDLDGDGRTMGRGDALGFGRFPGQYGMAILSRFPLGPARTFRTLPWAALPGAEPPRNPDGTPYWPDEVWRALPLSSKSHWDVTVALPDGRALHLLASHPTPPVFDGPEDRNGLRNAAEIGFWADYLDGTAFADDSGSAAPLAPEAVVVVLGDMNLDPEDGDGRREAIRRLLDHPRLQDPRPASAGGPAAAAAQGGANAGQRGDPALDTADWQDDRGGTRRQHARRLRPALAPARCRRRRRLLAGAGRSAGAAGRRGRSRAGELGPPAGVGGHPRRGLRRPSARWSLAKTARVRASTHPAASQKLGSRRLLTRISATEALSGSESA